MGSKSGPPGQQAHESRIECHADLSSFFHETLRSALCSRGVEAPPPTEHYLVTLLADLGHDEAAMCRSLVSLELAAREPADADRVSRLRALGDQALSVSGLFEVYLEHRGISSAYVVEVGSRAYRTASQLASASPRSGDRARAEVFYDLGSRFRTYAEVLDDVREKTALGTRDDVLSLYERYEKTGSKAVLDRLLEHGVMAVVGEDSGPKLEC